MRAEVQGSRQLFQKLQDMRFEIVIEVILSRDLIFSDRFSQIKVTSHRGWKESLYESERLEPLWADNFTSTKNYEVDIRGFVAIWQVSASLGRSIEDSDEDDPIIIEDVKTRLEVLLPSWDTW